MKIPQRIQPLVEDGLVDQVLRQLMSGKEIWSLYERGELQPDSPLTGTFRRSEKRVDLNEVMQVIDAAREEDALRRRMR